jgi:hypothetical protein
MSSSATLHAFGERPLPDQLDAHPMISIRFTIPFWRREVLPCPI